MTEWLMEQGGLGTVLTGLIGICLIWQIGRHGREARRALEGFAQDLWRRLNNEHQYVRYQHDTTREHLVSLLSKSAGSPTPTEAGSPMRLTEFGKEIDELLEADDWITKKADELRPKTAGLELFEIDQLSQDHTLGELETELKRKVDRAAYTRGCSTLAVQEVLRIRLRDALLPEPANPPKDERTP